MKRNWMYLILILLAGIGGAVLRGISLLHGYEPDSGLPVIGYMPAIALIVLTAAVIVAAVLFGRMRFSKTAACTFEQMFRGMGKVKCVLCSVAGLGIVWFSRKGLQCLPEQIVEQSANLNGELIYPGSIIVAAIALLWVLGIISGISLFLLAVEQAKGKQVSKRTGMYATVPLFWCCLDLILIYHENSGNPVTSDYSYALLLIIAVMTAFYSIGGFLFSSKGSAQRFFASVGVAIYLACTQIGGTCIWYLMTEHEYGMIGSLGVGKTIRLAAYACVGLYLLVYLVHALPRASKFKTEI